MSYACFINTMVELITTMCTYFQTVKGKNREGSHLSIRRVLIYATIFEFLEIKSNTEVHGNNDAVSLCL